MFGKNEIVGQKYFNDAGDKLYVTSIFFTIQGEGPFRGYPAVFVRFAKCNLACSFCFHGNTLINMWGGGRKLIRDIAVGDKVVSWDEETQTFVEGNVTHTFNRKVSKILRVRTGKSNNPSDLMYVTEEHPFLVKNKGWVKAGELVTGDVLLHYSVSNRMKLSNPRFDQDINDNLTNLARSPERLHISSERFKKTWRDNPKLREDVMYRAVNNNPMKDPVIAAKAFMTRKDRGRKSTIERKFERITHGLPISFVGDGSLPVGHKFPDFVVDGQKKLIEVWAHDADFAKSRDDSWMEKRRELFAKEGYEVLFVPMTTRKMDDQLIRKTVAEYINNGEVVMSVEEVDKNSINAWARLAGSKDNDLDVFNFEVENYHTYVAGGKIVHNCDTYFDGGDWLTIEEINQRIEKTIYHHFKGNVPDWMQSHCKEHSLQRRKCILVITGGEPMLQKNIVPFLEYMNKRFMYSQIESNGTVYQEIPYSTTLVISPKCSEKNGRPVKYLEPNQKVLERADCLKFVMNNDSESPYSTIPDWAFKARENYSLEIYCSPMNIYNKEPEKAKMIRSEKNDISLEVRSSVDEVISFWEEGLLNMKANQANHEYTARYCIDNNCVLNLQLHLYAGLA